MAQHVRLPPISCDPNLCSAESAQATLARTAAVEARQAGKAQELETALREASSLFKAEMAVKAAELHALHAELGCAATSETSEICCRSLLLASSPDTYETLRKAVPSECGQFTHFFPCFPLCQL